MAIALITDFGTQDSYVGVMKGVMAGICPTVPTIDITHDLPPQDLYAARFTVLSVYPYMPPDTVYLVVVDPGVGTARRAIAVQTQQGFFVGPDNGVLSGVVDCESVLKAVDLVNADYWRVPQPSATFHGRDIFAPVAAHLANGVPIDRLGTVLDPQSLITLPLTVPVVTETGWQGVVQYIDRFGNAATTIPASAAATDNWTLTVGATTLPSAKTYGSVPPGQGLALVGSHGYIEIAVNQGSAKDRLGLVVGDRVSIAYLRMTGGGKTR